MKRSDVEEPNVPRNRRLSEQLRKQATKGIAMSIAPIDPAQAEGEAAVRLEEMKRKFGGVPITARYLAHSVTTLDAFFGMTNAAMQTLTPRMREQLALFSAEHNDCSLCRAMHDMSARRAGLTEEEIDAARQGEAVDSKEDAALLLARSILDGRGRVGGEILEYVRGVGFDDQGLLEIFLLVTNNLMTNYFNRFVGLTAADLRSGIEEAA